MNNICLDLLLMRVVEGGGGKGGGWGGGKGGLGEARGGERWEVKRKQVNFTSEWQRYQ